MREGEPRLLTPEKAPLRPREGWSDFYSHLFETPASSSFDGAHAHEALKSKPIREQWKERHYAEVENPVTAESVESAIDSLIAFRQTGATEEGKEKRDAVCITQGRGAGALGFVEKNSENDQIERELGREPEHKFYIHYRPDMEEKLADQIEEAGESAKELMAKLRALWLAMEEVAYRSLKRLEEENTGNPAYDNFTAQYFPDGLTRGEKGKTLPDLVLRLMVYIQVEDGKLSANPHFDASGFTFSVWESGPGLQVGEEATDEKPEHLEDIERDGDTILFWPGSGIKKIDPELEPTYHAVRQVDDAEHKAEVGEPARAVFVVFLNKKGEAPPPMTETHRVKETVH